NNEYFEIQNVANQVLDTSGWMVAVSDSTTNINSGIKTQSLPATFSPGQVLYRTDLATDNYFGTGINWASSTSGRGWVMIVDSQGQIVDLVIWGWTSTQIAAMAANVGGFAITNQQIVAAWSGNGAAANGSTTNSL